MRSFDEAFHDRMRGALLGLAVGDALGTTVEFSPPGSFKPVTDMVGGGPFRLKAGEWTDDTSMALCLAESLIEKQRFDAVDQLRRYVSWWKEGHLSSTGRCFDIGIQTRQALTEHIQSGKPVCGPTGAYNAGNGSLMRLAPIAMAFISQPESAIGFAADSSRTTHGNAECVDACRFFAGLLIGAMSGVSKEVLLAPEYCPISAYWSAHPLSPKIKTVAAGSWRNKMPPLIRGSGYVVDCLEASIWAFATTESFSDAVLAAVNLGDDADTTGAVAGQLAGAFYGATAIPATWRSKLAQGNLIDQLSIGLVQFAERQDEMEHHKPQ